MKTILSLICLLSFAILLNAQKAGTLDKSFGDTGVVIGTTYSGNCQSLLVQNDGKLIATGEGGYNNVGGFLAVRYNYDGSLDLSFGDSGRIATSISSKGSVGSFGALQNDGKIVITGVVAVNGIIGNSVATVRYTATGHLDSTFGTNGIVITDLGSQYENPSGILIQNDGRIVITGGLYNYGEGQGPDTIYVISYNPDGTLDAGFANNGIYKEAAQGPITTAGAALQADGKILVGGNYAVIRSNAFFVKRYTSNGKLDSAFGVNGEADYKFFNSNASYIRSIFLQQDGKIIAGGNVYFTLHRATATLARFNSDGSIDNSFGIEGMLTTVIPDYSSEADNITAQSDNQILIAGTIYDTLRNDSGRYMIARYSANGFVDSSFGTNGVTITNIGQEASASSIALQTGGKIVVGGSLFELTPPYYFVSLARYNNGDETKKQKIISKIKHHIQNHNNLESSSTADAKVATLNISLAPNPVNSILNINGLSASTKYDVRITNESGNTVAIKQINNVSSYKINVQGLSAGVYYVNIISNNTQSTTLKFIKQ